MEAARVQVVATNDNGTRIALAEATRLANGSASRVLLLVPHVVPFFGAVGDHETATAITDRYRELAAEVGANALVRLCVCRRLDDMFRLMLGPGAPVVVGGEHRWWWPSAAERLARRLRRQGHDVLFARA